jgi:hypothetical protein
LRDFWADILRDFYAQALFNPQWGEQIRLQPGRRLSIQMVFQGLDREQAEAVRPDHF